MKSLWKEFKLKIFWYTAVDELGFSLHALRLVREFEIGRLANLYGLAAKLIVANYHECGMVNGGGRCYDYSVECRRCDGGKF